MPQPTELILNPPQRYQEGCEPLNKSFDGSGQQAPIRREEQLKELSEAEAENVELTQKLEASLLEGAQQTLINLNMRMRIDRLRLGTAIMVCGYKVSNAI